MRGLTGAEYQVLKDQEPPYLDEPMSRSEMILSNRLCDRTPAGQLAMRIHECLRSGRVPR